LWRVSISYAIIEKHVKLIFFFKKKQKQKQKYSYIWWDFLHPSSKTHAKIATAIYHYVESLNW
jgi:lysophospholipase L1-like esterase